MKKDKQLNIFVSSAWKEKIIKAAELSGKTYSEYIRYVCEKEADNNLKI